MPMAGAGRRGRAPKGNPMRFSTALICLLLAGLALPADAHAFSAGALKILHPWARATAAGARNAICDSGWYRQ